ncbi:hypothetical protein SIPHO067v1_p0095 [Vibrio phage 51E28.1]|nr:hypothetical protein SIPHO068v1_p0004 [Vibrio phage 51E28.4]QZI92935.1 hypothetical protein SIPHO067v1_p0095 [Vibrio phage 51E28.1]
MALSLKQKLEKAHKVCEEGGTRLDTVNGEVVFVEHNPIANKKKVRKICKADKTHPHMEVTLGSIIAAGRGGCAKCARIKGGQNSKRT